MNTKRIIHNKLYIYMYTYIIYTNEIEHTKEKLHKKTFKKRYIRLENTRIIVLQFL